ncbi:MAG: hypothetical protein ACK49R_12380 [Planctomycetota bacterium]
MLIPRCWKLVEGNFPDRAGGTVRLSAWGCGEDEAAAEEDGRERLERVAASLNAGKVPEQWYGYPDRPVREEILQTFDGPTGDPESQVAVVTRNGYGALVLNTARMLFLDIDLAMGLGQTIRSWFGQASPEQTKLAQLQHLLSAQGNATFRIYRTAAGFRVIGLGREYDPAGREAEELMEATGTDPQFRRLCTVQKCFRARLTPKPWRCGVPRPWVHFPYRDEAAEQEMRSWISRYEAASARYATCRFLAEVGSLPPSGDEAILLEIHDCLTGVGKGLPLG